MKSSLCILSIRLVLALSLGLEACIEDENDLISQKCGNQCATLNGFLTTGDGSEPLKDAELEVIWKNTVYLGGGTLRTKAITQSDVNGYYELKLRVREDELEEGYFIVKIYTNENYLSCGKAGAYHYFAISELTNDTIITTDYGIPYKATLKISSTGASEMADNDYFSLTARSPVGINYGGGCGQVATWTNKIPNNEYIVDVAAEQPVIISVGVRRGAQRFKNYDTLYLEKGEQLEYVAEF